MRAALIRQAVGLVFVAAAISSGSLTLVPRLLPLARTVSRGVKMSLPRSIPPTPVFLRPGRCGARHANGTAACDSAILRAIDDARKSEPLGVMPRSFNLAAYERLTPPEQMFAIADIERVARGLPAIEAMTPQLNNMAASSAADQVEPTIDLPLRITTGGIATTYGSNFAEGTANALGADYFWMYDDGLNSPNASCTKRSPGLCWAHRRNVLEDYGSTRYCPRGSRVNLLMGAAEAVSNVALSPAVAEIFVNDCGARPTDVSFTWQDVLKLVFAQ